MKFESYLYDSGISVQFDLLIWTFLGDGDPISAANQFTFTPGNMRNGGQGGVTEAGETNVNSSNLLNIKP